MSTVAERTVLVPFEDRTAYIPRAIGFTISERTVQIPFENRTAYIVKDSSSEERTVYVSELY
tara:strand:+ start:131 stop:316 length:186 start_codon:yes stop_codon:yes gene_type:complete